MKHINLLSHHILKSVLLVAVTATLISCASTQKEIDPKTEFSGFHVDYSQLTLHNDGRYIWVSEELKKGKYKKIMLETVTVYPPELLKDNKNADLILQTVKELDKAFAASISKEFELVKKPGKDVLQIRSALTGEKSEMLGMTGWEVLPVAAVVGGVMAATETRPRIVQIVFESEGLDSITKERVYMVVRKGGATLENRKVITQEDFMVIVKKFAVTAAEGLAKILK